MLLVPIAQLLFAAVAGFGLFRLYRIIAMRNPTIGLFVGIGIVARSLLGQAAFWISYLHLPLRPTLQVGNGLWWYAVDGISYFAQAVDAADRGIRAIVFFDHTLLSWPHVQLFAVFVALFGRVTSVALLMNVTTYLTTCFLITTTHSKPSAAGIGAVAAISLSPSIILWSLQPLKDTLFMLLITALFSAACRWRLNACGDGSIGRYVQTTAAFALIVYLTCALRWYFGVAILGAVVPFCVIVAARSKYWRRAAAMACLALGVLAYAFMAGAGTATDFVNKIVHSPQPFAEVPRAMLNALDGVRSGFESTPAGTVLRFGHRLTNGAATPAAPESTMRRSLRLLTGVIAATVPHFIAQRTGLIDIRGGQGLWLFADVDTVVFDGILIFVGVWIVRAFRRRVVLTPLVIYAVGVAMMCGIPIIYGVGQFGAMFRFRSMITLAALLIPVAVAFETAMSSRLTPAGVPARREAERVAEVCSSVPA